MPVDSESRDATFLVDDCTKDSQDSRQTAVEDSTAPPGTIVVGDFLKLDFKELGCEFARNANG